VARRSAPSVLFLIAALSLAPFAFAQDADAPSSPTPVELTVTGHDDDGFYFTVDGLTGKNPTIRLPPDTHVVVTFTSKSGVHNFNADAFGKTEIIGGGATTSLEFDTASEGTFEYWCDPHKGSGMKGVIEVTSAAAGGAGETPAEAVDDGPPAPVTLAFHGWDDDGFYFTVEGYEGHNPTITIQPGAEVTVTYVSDAGVHNLNMGDLGKVNIADPSAAMQTFTFTAPASGESEYWCDPHKGSGMKGKLVFGSAPAPGGGGVVVTGDSIDLGQFDAACTGQSAPAMILDDPTPVGAPRLSDYIEACKTGTSGASPARPAHMADYAIPGSLVLIALGIVGFVWVNKFYKP